MQLSKSRPLSLLAEFGAAAMHGGEIADIIDFAAECAREGLRASKVAVLVPIAAATLAPIAVSGWERGVIHDMRIPAGGSEPAAQVFRLGPRACFRFDRGHGETVWPEMLVAGGIDSVLAASFGAGGSSYGVIEAAADARDHFDADDAAFLAALANLLASAILRLGQAFRPNGGEMSAGLTKAWIPLRFTGAESGFIWALFEKLPVGIALLSRMGTILHANALYNLYASAEISTDAHVPDKTFFDVHDAVSAGEVPLCLPDGRAVWVKVDRFPMLGVEDAMIGSCAIVTDITPWRSTRSPSNNPELPRRIRNILSVVRVIARRTAEGSGSIEDYAAVLESRIGALARVQSGMITDPAAGVDVGALVTDELLAHSIKDDGVTMGGPKIRLWAKAAESLALVIHELTCNAIKYGALSTKSGRIDIAWWVDDGVSPPTLEFEWRESGVAIIASAPRRRGFGHELIERGLPYELSARTSIDFRPGGVCCAIAIPLTSGSSPSYTGRAI